VLKFDAPHHAIDDRATLRRLLDATLLIEADLDVTVVLRHVVEEACAMTGARFGALGVLNDEGTALTDFITSGLEPDEEERIGPRPTGHGVLGLLISEPAPLRLTRLSDHPQSFGFPLNHPPMTSFLGAPIKVRDHVYGNLYLTDKDGLREFTGDDEASVTGLAVAAGIAIENAHLHRQVQLAVLTDERERIARDLHDTVIQRMFGAGLTLQGIAGMIGPGLAAERLDAVVVDIDDSIRELRSIIFALGLTGEEQDVRARLLSLLAELRLIVGFEVRARFDGPVDSLISLEIADHLLAVAREAITNVARHARATRAEIELSASDGWCTLTILDNGLGLQNSEKTRAGGMGLINLRRRAEKLGGEFHVESPVAGGTVLTWKVPVDENH
jgi:signal transduction histidine kinase